MTTIPTRIDLIKPVIDSVFKQTIPVKWLEINVPLYCVRTGDHYIIPAWLQEYEGVKIYRTEDYGAITKIAPTLERHKEDDLYVWSIDDDIEYPSRMLATLWYIVEHEDKKIVTFNGGDITATRYVNGTGEGYCMVLEGFSTVLYPPRCIDDEFMPYVEKTSAELDCVKSDDIVLSNYFGSLDVPIYRIGDRYKSYNFHKFSMPYWDLKDALHNQDDGHFVRYLRVVKWLREEGLLCKAWSTATATPTPKPTAAELNIKKQYVGGIPVLKKTTREFFNLTKK
jgi:hypothetical protein